jgi:uncharacterized protein
MPARSPAAGVVAILVLLVALVALRRVDVARWVDVTASAAVGVSSVGVARAVGLTWEQLGLSPGRLGAGVRLGGLVLLAVVAALAVVWAMPATRGWLDDDRVGIGTGAMLVTVLVATPLGVVLLEELVFRSALFGLLASDRGTGFATVASSLLFGIWHVPPTLRTAPGNPGLAEVSSTTPGMVLTVTGMVLAMALAGAFLCWLRIRSGSVAAPTIAHLATNCVTFAVAWLASRP